MQIAFFLHLLEPEASRLERTTEAADNTPFAKKRPCFASYLNAIGIISIIFKINQTLLQRKTLLSLGSTLANTYFHRDVIKKFKGI